MEQPKKLTLTAYRDINGSLNRIPDRDPFSVMLNPENITIKAGINNKKKALGHLMFVSYKRPEVVIPTLIFDTTGAIPTKAWPGGYTSVTDMVLFLESVVYSFDDESHQAPVIEVIWGEICHYARVKNFETKYSLFNINGKPMRAEVTLTLESFYTDLPAETEQDKKSPDLTHLVEVKSGDSLPLMCERIYNNSSYYLQVARINGLTNFRNLKPGMMLEFPPIRE